MLIFASTYSIQDALVLQAIPQNNLQIFAFKCQFWGKATRVLCNFEDLMATRQGTAKRY